MNRAPLLVLRCGMTTAVGLTAPASCAAIRAGLDRFQETRFVARGGTRLIAAMVPLEETWRGLERVARLAAGPIRECLEAASDVPVDGIPLLLCVAEPDRPGRLAGLNQELMSLVAAKLGIGLHPASRIVAMGRVGGGIALREAARLLTRARARGSCWPGPIAMSSLRRLRRWMRGTGCLPSATQMASSQAKPALRCCLLQIMRDRGCVSARWDLARKRLQLRARSRCVAKGWQPHIVKLSVTDWTRSARD